MNFDKLLKIGVTLAVIGIIIYRFAPTVIEGVGEAKEVISSASTEYTKEKIILYMDSKPDYYFKYEGAVYCLVIDSLVDEGIVKRDAFNDEDKILQVSYSSDEYHFSINNECEER